MSYGPDEFWDPSDKPIVPDPVTRPATKPMDRHPGGSHPGAGSQHGTKYSTRKTPPNRGEMLRRGSKGSARPVPTSSAPPVTNIADIATPPGMPGPNRITGNSNRPHFLKDSAKWTWGIR